MESTEKKYRIVLASASPRRKELLGWLEVPFEIIPSHVEEVTTMTRPHDVAEDLAALKGEDIYRKLEDSNEVENPFVISSDTIVTLGETIYGKPKDKEDAFRMLNELSGKTHQVVTGVAMFFEDRKTKEKKRVVFSVSTLVTFDSIDKDLLENYVNSNDPLDKAGAYGIQGQGLSFISRIDGSYSNVVGFPLSDFVDHFKKALELEHDSLGTWRELFN